MECELGALLSLSMLSGKRLVIIILIIFSIILMIFIIILIVYIIIIFISIFIKVGFGIDSGLVVVATVILFLVCGI